MKALLDTHVLLWYLTADRKLAKTHHRTIDSAEKRNVRVGLSAASLWEVAKLHQLGRVRLPGSIEEFVHYIERHACFEILPLTGDVAIESTRLGDAFPKDPFDQIIVATARVHELALLTADQRIIASRAVKCT